MVINGKLIKNIGEYRIFRKGDGMEDEQSKVIRRGLSRLCYSEDFHLLNKAEQNEVTAFADEIIGLEQEGTREDVHLNEVSKQLRQTINDGFDVTDLMSNYSIKIERDVIRLGKERRELENDYERINDEFDEKTSELHRLINVMKEGISELKTVKNEIRNEKDELNNLLNSVSEKMSRIDKY